MAGRGSHFLGPSMSGGEDHHLDPLCLERGLVPRWRMQLDRSSSFLASELASSWHYRLLDGVMSSMGLHLLAPNECSVARKGG
jgi:hypothetical protein